MKKRARVCPSCGYSGIIEGDRYCEKCGKELPDVVICTNCGREQVAGASFCDFCGRKLLTESLWPEREEEKTMRQASIGGAGGFAPPTDLD